MYFLPVESRMQKWGAGLLAVTFFFFGLTSLVSKNASVACLSNDYLGEIKLDYCNESLAAGFWMVSISANDRAQWSPIYLEKGIALAQMGNEDEAVAEFRREIADAGLRNGIWRQRLHNRMDEFYGTRAFEVFDGLEQQTDG